MPQLQITSIRSPFDDPQLSAAAIGALTRADAMGLLTQPVTCLDEAAMRNLGTGIAEAGIGQSFLSPLQEPSRCTTTLLATLLERVSEALDESPVPSTEWRALQDVLGPDLLTRLLGISSSSLQRYASGERGTPDNIAARLHFLALLVGDLAGAYNDIGVRRWFDRRRELLNGATPAEALGEEWSPEDDGPRRVRELSSALAFSPAT